MKVLLIYLVLNTYFFNKCLQVEDCICSNNGANCLSKYNTPKDLIAYFNFDNSVSNDLWNSTISPFPFGAPGKNKDGYSLFLAKNSNYEINNNFKYPNEVTIMFWVYLRDNKYWSSLVYDKNKSFSLRINPKNGNIILVLKKDNKNWSFRTKSNLIEKKWNHITLTLSKYLAKIYINGFLDINKKLTYSFNNDLFKLNLGSNENYKSSLVYIDELKIFNKIKTNDEIYDNYNDNNTFYEYDDYKIACLNCKYIEALNKCGNDYHICNLSEIYYGAFQFIRANGFLKNNNDVWYKVENYNLLIKQNQTKLGVCCKNIN